MFFCLQRLKQWRRKSAHHCVEPCPDSVNRIEKHFRAWGFQDRTSEDDVKKAGGAAERSGEAFIPSYNQTCANTVHSSKQPRRNGSGDSTLDAAAVAGIWLLQPRPTYIKCDIETNEVPVIKRLLSSSAIASVNTIAMEVDDASEAEELQKLLQTVGFTVEIKYEPEIIIIAKEHPQGAPEICRVLGARRCGQ